MALTRPRSHGTVTGRQLQASGSRSTGINLCLRDGVEALARYEMQVGGTNCNQDGQVCVETTQTCHAVINNLDPARSYILFGANEFASSLRASDLYNFFWRCTVSAT